MVMPDRKYSAGSEYRYGFNGKEDDKDISEGGQDYGMRIYDTRLGKFLSVDPLTAKYPWYTPYQFAGNKPINNVDLDGLEEFNSYEAYKNSYGDKAMSEDKWDGSDGAWLVSDRSAKSTRWSNAMDAITRNQWTDRFKTIDGAWTSSIGDEFGVGAGENESYQLREGYSFGLVRDYYNWFQHQMDARGIKSQWAKGASYLVDELDHSVFSMQMAGVYDLFHDLNLGIAQFATTMFHERLYGDNKKEGWDFDYDFITREQVTVAAPPVYKKYEGSQALNTANTMARKTGFLGNTAGFLSNFGKFFPSFADFGVSINDPKTNFGAGGRQHIPMLMLYTEKHAAFLLSQQNYKCTQWQMIQVKAANEQIEDYYQTQMKF